MKPPDDDEPVVNDQPLLGDAPVQPEVPPALVTVEEPGLDFEAMLGSYSDLALHVVVGDEQPDGDRPRARVGRYERRDP